MVLMTVKAGDLVKGSKRYPMVLLSRRIVRNSMIIMNYDYYPVLAKGTRVG